MNPDTETIDGHADEIGHEVAVVHTPPTTLFRTDDPVEVVEKASRVADALKDVIVRKNLFTMIQGKQHIGVEGWQLVGAMLGVTAVCVHTEPVDGGFMATVEARTSDGRVIGRADALCTRHEKRGPWKTADDYARLSMAQTRATSKALKGPLGFVVSLAGYATTPAEEMTFVEPDAAPETDIPSAPDPLPAIGPDRSATLLLNSDSAGITREALRLAVGHATQVEVPSLEDDEKAVDLLAELSDKQEERVSKWVEKKRAQAKEAEAS
jgi:hypothetical protein